MPSTKKGFLSWSKLLDSPILPTVCLTRWIIESATSDPPPWITSRGLDWLNRAQDDDGRGHYRGCKEIQKNTKFWNQKRVTTLWVTPPLVQFIRPLCDRDWRSDLTDFSDPGAFQKLENRHLSQAPTPNCPFQILVVFRSDWMDSG